MVREYNFSHTDKGCEFADSCLNCPFTKCIDDKPGNREYWKKRQRYEEIVRLFKKGEGISDLATAFGVSKRTIQRAVKTGSKGG